MKKWMLWLIAMLAMNVGVLRAQDISGTWQGALPIAGGKQLRTVIKVSKADDGGLKAVMYSIDQGAQGIPATSFALQGNAVKMSIAAIGGTYEGKLSADGNTITGTWTQGPNPQPLNLTRATDATAWAIPEPPPPLKPMAADANAVFEVATIKPSNPDAPGKGFAVRGRNFSTLNTNLSDLITFAYGLHAKQIIGMPAWMGSDKYDLAAVPEAEGVPSQIQLKMMVQKLLAERFQLAFHREKRDLDVYAITVGKTGSRMTKSASDPNGLPGLFFTGPGVLNVRNASISDLANVMQGAVLDRPVVDQTELSGKYDFVLKWTPDEFQFASMGIKTPAPTDSTTAAPDLFTAIQQQLGLKLEGKKAPVDVLVVDHVDKPSAN